MSLTGRARNTVLKHAIDTQPIQTLQTWLKSIGNDALRTKKADESSEFWERRMPRKRDELQYWIKTCFSQRLVAYQIIYFLVAGHNALFHDLQIEVPAC
jgi:hypothetical protein